MPELRWTLAIVGALFIVGLAVWEFRRQRQAPRVPGAGQGTQGNDDRVAPTLESGGAQGSRVHREPTITLPELHPELRPDLRPDMRMSARREPARDPRIVEVDDAAFERLHVEGESDTPELSAEFDADEWAKPADVAPGTEHGDSMSDLPGPEGEVVWGEPEGAPSADAHVPAAWNTSNDPPSSNARSPSAWGTAGDAAPSATRDDAARPGPASRWATPAEAASAKTSSASAWATPDDASPAGAQRATPDAAGHSLESESSVGFATDDDAHLTDTDTQPTLSSATDSADSAKLVHAHPEGATADGAPIVDWPREQSRKIVALRLVSAPAARFQGRAVRQALAAEGFILGKFDIFHKPGPDDRAVLSAASLSKPGTFTMNTIDAQRFGGISLFAVLPGPLPAQETFDELLTTARSLNDRLQGALQDERGEPLTPVRSATIRQSLYDGSGSDGDGGDAGQSETRQ